MFRFTNRDAHVGGQVVPGRAGPHGHAPGLGQGHRLLLHRLVPRVDPQPRQEGLPHHLPGGESSRDSLTGVCIPLVVCLPSLLHVFFVFEDSLEELQGHPVHRPRNLLLLEGGHVILGGGHHTPQPHAGAGPDLSPAGHDPDVDLLLLRHLLGPVPLLDQAVLPPLRAQPGLHALVNNDCGSLLTLLLNITHHGGAVHVVASGVGGVHHA
mmetsp:Transcript_21839/g.31694  ORF Transcript_21839/g.31694 Transcript_21839/m.31694 type:complete len:210 (+) Transcript_21839:374-1003(+)